MQVLSGLDSTFRLPQCSFPHPKRKPPIQGEMTRCCPPLGTLSWRNLQARLFSTSSQLPTAVQCTKAEVTAGACLGCWSSRPWLARLYARLADFLALVFLALPFLVLAFLGLAAFLVAGFLVLSMQT